MSSKSHVMKLNNTLYRIGCDCGDPSCDLIVSIERDNDINTINISGTIHSYNPRTDSIWKEIKWRLKAVKDIISNGRIEADAEIVVQRKSHIEGIIEVLNKLKDQL